MYVARVSMLFLVCGFQAIYLIIRRCARTGAFPGGVCNGPFISPDSNHSSRNSTFSKQHFSPRDDQHGGKPSCPLADRQGGATLARFGGL